MGVQIEDLEARLNYDKDLRNEVVIATDDGIVVYVGEAIGLYFQGMDIRGSARLSKYQRELSKCPGEGGTENQKEAPVSVEDRNIWTLNSDDHIYFVSFGELKTGYDCDAHYRCDLKRKAANKGLRLYHKLFETVFGPIDSEIMDMYKRARRIE